MIFKYETQLITTNNYDTTQLNTRQKLNTRNLQEQAIEHKMTQRLDR